MRKDYEAIVVGAGLAGLTSAAYLARGGVKVLLLEKRKKTGGLVETFRHQGFAFDAGIRAFENSGILFPMLKDLGLELDHVRNPVSTGIGEGMVRLGGEESLMDYLKMLTDLFPEEASAIQAMGEEIRKVMGYMEVLYGIDNPLFMGEADLDYLRNTLLPWFLKYQVNIRKASRLKEPIRSYLSRFTWNVALVDMIIQHFFQETPAFFALSYFSLYLDYAYPLGGTGALAKVLTEYVEERGGEIRLGAGVAGVESQTRTLVLESGEELGYGELVWAADQRSLYAQTTGIRGKAFRRQKALTERSTGGDSILTLFLGADLPPSYFQERSGGHLFYTPGTLGLSSLPSWEEAMGEGGENLLPWLRSYLERTTFEISLPALRDPTLAPPGQTGVIISTLLDYPLVVAAQELGLYEAFKEEAMETILRVLGASVFPGLQEKVLFRFCATPLTLERETHNFQGAITGWAFTNPILPAEHRFSRIAKGINTPIPHVFQCGQWSFSPSGLPVSIVTGKLAADQVLKRVKKGRKG